MLEVPTANNGWNLDVVSILAVLGEHNIQLNSHLMCVSRLCFLPRLLPAPQGLLAGRPRVLPIQDEVQVVGIYTGLEQPHLHYFANLLHGDGTQIPVFAVRELRITFASDEPYTVRPRRFSPINLITIANSIISSSLLVWATVIRDYIALAGILIMSFTTPILCAGLKWIPASIPRRRTRGIPAPANDVIFKSTTGTLTIVRCDTDVARMLYFTPTKPKYMMNWHSGRGISGFVGGLTLMTAIVLFGNASWTMQLALVVTYSALNALYWIATVLPQEWAWDFNFVVEELYQSRHGSFLQTVWVALWKTRETSWVEKMGSAFQTTVWERWLKLAVEHFDEPVDLWDPLHAYSEVLESTAVNP
ncbi:hypothetical protein AJ79_04431 [Helicocarpus griseus UAMH5409]|uniref:Uncharacterized protein n=1 Tax=Helicocarpus griseus UAMH5409 TaxID=1447875 RepID=A0A2B7XU06_9EURO|nr:hypothetical protein AJ79_04431 [Helicocarpus griseus UAMH5409]